MNPRDFVEAFRDAVAEYGWKQTVLPAQAIAMWQQVVDFVEAGYNDNIYELHNDMAIRQLIEHLLHNERLRQCEEFGWFREEVDEADRRLRNLLQPEPLAPGLQLPWWEAHTPRYGGPDLVADFKQLYDVAIEER